MDQRLVVSGAGSGTQQLRAVGDRAPIVWKFGGTSVVDHDRLRAVAERMVTAQRAGHKVVAILSAMGRSTDALAAMAHEMSARPPLRELDALLSVGESISCALASIAVAELGSHAVSLNGRQAGIRTDDNYGNARLDDVEPRRIHERSPVARSCWSPASRGCRRAATSRPWAGVAPTLPRWPWRRLWAPASARSSPTCRACSPPIRGSCRRTPAGHRPPRGDAGDGRSRAGVLQPRSVELAMAHGMDIHLRSSFSTDDGTWIRRQADGTSSGRRRRSRNRAPAPGEPVRGRGGRVGAVTAALAERGIAIGRRYRLGVRAPVHRARRGAGRDDRRAGHHRGARQGRARSSVGIGVVSLGIARKPEIPMRAIAALEAAGIEPHLITTTAGRVTVLVASAQVDDAVRVLHAIFVPAVLPTLTCGPTRPPGRRAQAADPLPPVGAARSPRPPR